MKQTLPTKTFRSTGDFTTWLDAHHGTSKGIWLKIAKKQTGRPTVTYAQALEVALCFGWIDGQKAAFDDAWWLQKFSPRGTASKWSKINRTKALDLIAAKQMKPAGLAAVEAAKRSGRWDAAYDSPRTASVPDDLARSLDRDPKAAALFATLNSANRYAILYRLQQAKKPETRARRLEQIVAMLGRHEKFHP